MQHEQNWKYGRRTWKISKRSTRLSIDFEVHRLPHLELAHILQEGIPWFVAHRKGRTNRSLYPGQVRLFPSLAHKHAFLHHHGIAFRNKHACSEVQKEWQMRGDHPVYVLHLHC